MSLIYRGQTAQPPATAQTVETGLNGTFLGRSFPIRSGKTQAIRSNQLMQYRGVIY